MLERAIIYTRVSSGTQKDNFSQLNQVTASKQFIQDNNFVFYQHHHDVQSGLDYLERKGVDLTLQAVRNQKVRLVVFNEVDRNGRDADLIKQFIIDIFDAGGIVGIVGKRQIYTDKYDCLEDTLLDRAFAEKMRYTIERNTRAGKILAAQLGSFMLTPAFGYKVVKEAIIHEGRPQVISKAVVDEAKLPLAQRTFELFFGGSTIGQIARTINNEFNAIWTPHQAKRILANALKYAGQPFSLDYPVEKKRYEVLPNGTKGKLLSKTVRLTYTYPPILTKEEAIKATEMLETLPKFKGNIPKPFKRLVECSYCHSRTTTTYNKSYDRNRRFFHIQCATKNRQRAYQNSNRPVTFTPCQYNIPAHVFVKELSNYLAAFSHPSIESKLENELVSHILTYIDLREHEATVAEEIARVEKEKLLSWMNCFDAVT